MEIIKGKFCSCTVFSETCEQYAALQIKNICDNEVSSGSRMCVMPDVHPGKVAPIGLTMTVENRVLPYLVGIDIGCGMTLARIKKHRGMEFKQLDSVIRENIPSGFEVRKNPHRFSADFDFSRLECGSHVYKEKAVLSLGSLGGGNHFIEIDKSEEGDFFIVVHSGSRHLGKEVADFYLGEGQKILKNRGETVPFELIYIEENLKDLYLSDVAVVQKFAERNRRAIIDEIARGMKWKIDEPYSCIHNYVDFRTEKPVLRKGAVSAQKDERVIIPINMKDGIILGKGKGNPDWNFSAPHGSGRIMKREDVKKSFTVSSFKSAMKGIYSSCISKGTLDEAPFAYRGIDEIQKAIEPTVEITQILKPVYNFKAQSEA
ncbi:RtcB family protein [Treponema zioleckii]|uniref:RtcB family protein n=1 Tax=Treponema zioleckii TaxID=331680 RepID=UPI00168B480A|nr:RtcB family protein [Treponema zioleckii]